MDSDENIGQHTSIVLDVNGYPHITCAGVSGLKYIRWTGLSWSIQTVDSDGSVGQHTSIALDDTDYPHISYFDYTNGDLKYARWVQP